MRMPATAAQVFAVLADGWSYGHWVVGSTHIRDVAPTWPQVGAAIAHSIGAWPLMVQDSTAVIAADPPHMLELQARAWPFGQARIRLEINEIDATTVEVRMLETVSHGPGRLLPGALQAALLKPRNSESLARLHDLVTSGYRTIGD
ncbi:SRPBCC family protein [Nocardia sp. NPDC052001]|uniref:SRPBCC family protein n=1 Tax=Nocardia sp. NPDC052001 TaxID=3154853 RepID=UPI00344A610C